MYFVWRILRDRRYWSAFGERLGRLPFLVHRTAAPSVWFHAVSVGEVISAIPLIQAIRAEYPNAPLFVSCGTLAGRVLAKEKLHGLVDGLFYAPLDYRSVVRRVLRKLRPGLVVILETEIWPNLYRETKISGAALMVVNGRISDRALPRYRRLRWFFSAALAQPDAILVQTERDRGRYIAIGAPPDRVAIGGNLKYDFNPAAGEIPRPVAEFLQLTAPEQTWIAASTMPPAAGDDLDEDDVVIGAFQQLSDAHRRLLLILVPRKPERFDAVAGKLDAAGLRFVRRSQLKPGDFVVLPGVLLLDSIGELSRLFAIADVVLMGGSLANRGGHNVLEPAFFGKPVIAGRHMENFADIATEFTDAGALIRIDDASALGEIVGGLLRDAKQRRVVGEKARSLAESKRGVKDRVVRVLLDTYFGVVPGSPPRPVLHPLAKLWSIGVTLDRSRGLNRQGTLVRPVISVGGISMGGAGKTPVTEWLAAKLHEQGLMPAILTRGYRRRSVESRIIIPAGLSATAEQTGDEAQVFVRARVAHVGIGSDRFATGSEMERLLAPDVFVLDDGFQHWRLHRDLDIVLIDALEPFGGGSVFPEGRLREPLEGLARASVFIITRTERGVRTDGIESVLRRYNKDAPIFHSRVAPQRWHEFRSETSIAADTPPFSRVAAFCGLANPNAFWRTLEELGLHIVYRWSFGDHHRYHMDELKRLIAHAVDSGAEAIVTTEKDLMNIPEELPHLFRTVPLWWLKIGVEIDHPALPALIADHIAGHSARE